MADVSILSKKNVCGRSKKYTTTLAKVVEKLALNRTGRLNYNQFGARDGIGFIPCTEKFVDSFVLRDLVADYLTENGKYTEIGSVNKSIRSLLDRNQLHKCQVKAIAFSKQKETPPQNVLEKMPYRNVDINSPNTVYFYQEYKVACSDEHYDDVLQFLRSKTYNERGLFLKDIDVTMDYSGSFNRDDVVTSMVDNYGFREQGSDQCGERTIVDNVTKVGDNCLSYMETVNGMTTRCKIYNKMVQMLECKAVRDNIGSHWKDWVCQKATRLADARDKASLRGLTRAEVTFYCDNCVPTDQIMENTLIRITQYVDKDLVYSTPYAKTWAVYCNSFVHSLVVVDRPRKVAILVYSYNELTKNISGQVIDKWPQRERWCLANLTLSGNLPIDFVEVHELCKTLKPTGQKSSPKRGIRILF